MYYYKWLQSDLIYSVNRALLQLNSSGSEEGSEEYVCVISVFSCRLVLSVLHCYGVSPAPLNLLSLLMSMKQFLNQVYLN